MRAKFLTVLAMLPLLALLGGCNLVVMSPSGYIAEEQSRLIVVSVILMLTIVLPVIAATFLFAWRYRAGNRDATYDPDWHHSTGLEVLIWTAPLMIIIALGALTWISTHLLDPYRPLTSIDRNTEVTAETRPLTVEVVALDWKWMFFYPDLGIATVNELAAPVDVPINFKITSSAIMNSFFIPALAGQIYAMPGMETKLHAVINQRGVYDGFSANYSGPGFSRMRFKFHGMEPGAFDEWVAKVRAEGQPLDRARYLEVARPSEAEPVHYYASVENGLYQAVLNMCVDPGRMCMNEMMHLDMQGGVADGHEGNRERLLYDQVGVHDGFGFGATHGSPASEAPEAPGATFPATGREPRSENQPEGTQPQAGSTGTANDAAQPQGGEGSAAGHEGHSMQGQEGGGEGAPAPAGETSPAPPQLNR